MIKLPPNVAETLGAVLLGGLFARIAVAAYRVCTERGWVFFRPQHNRNPI
jgi:hypothetical protein